MHDSESGWRTLSRLLGYTGEPNRIAGLSKLVVFGIMENMERVIINNKDLSELVNAKRTLAMIDRKKRMRFIEAAFGALKGEFGSGSSAAYVTKLRRSSVAER